MIYDPLYEPISGQNAVANQHKPNFGLGGSSSHYDDSFGPCSKCLDLIVGTSTGCSAMGRLYHIKCFTCHHCGCQLQGKPYYALDGKVCLITYNELNFLIHIFVHLPFHEIFFVNFRTFYLWLLHKYLLKHKCIKIIRTILMIMSHLRSLFDWKACRVFLKLPGLGISLLMYDFSMYFKHTNSLIESIVNGQIDLEATIRRTLLLLSKLTVITILSISAFLWDRLPEYPRKMLQMSQTHLRSNT